MSIDWAIQNLISSNYNQCDRKKQYYELRDTVDSRLKVCPCCNTVWEYKIYGEKRQTDSKSSYRTYNNIPTIGKLRIYMPGHNSNKELK